MGIPSDEQLWGSPPDFKATCVEHISSTYLRIYNFCTKYFETRGVELGHNSGFVNGNMRLLITANEWGDRRRRLGAAANDFIEEVIVAPSLTFPDY